MGSTTAFLFFSSDTSGIAPITQEHRENFQPSGPAETCFSPVTGLVVSVSRCDLSDIKEQIKSSPVKARQQHVGGRAPGSSSYKHLWDIMSWTLYEFGLI